MNARTVLKNARAMRGKLQVILKNAGVTVKTNVQFKNYLATLNNT